MIDKPKDFKYYYVDRDGEIKSKSVSPNNLSFLSMCDHKYRFAYQWQAQEFKKSIDEYYKNMREMNLEIRTNTKRGNH